MVVVQNVPASSQPLMTRFQPFDPLAQLQQQPAPLQQQTHRAPEPQQHQPYVQESLFGNPRPFQVPDGGVQSVEVSDQYGSVVNVAVPQRIDQARRAQLEQQQTRDRAIAAAAASGSDGVEPHRIRYRTAEGWTDPMCDCWMYCGLCLCATLLTPWRFAQTSARAQTHPYYASLAAYLPLWAASLTFLIYILFINVRLPVYTWVMGVAFVLGLIWIGSVQRTQLRRKYQIRVSRWCSMVSRGSCVCSAPPAAPPSVCWPAFSESKHSVSWRSPHR